MVQVVSAEEGQRLAEEHRALFLETSAKADTNVHALFQQIGTARCGLLGVLFGHVNLMHALFVLNAALALPSSGGPKRESLFTVDKPEKQTCCF
jgi:hypothetical protein